MLNSCTTNLSDGALYISMPLVLSLGWSIFSCRRIVPRIGTFIVIQAQNIPEWTWTTILSVNSRLRWLLRHKDQTSLILMAGDWSSTHFLLHLFYYFSRLSCTCMLIRVLSTNWEAASWTCWSWQYIVFFLHFNGTLTLNSYIYHTRIFRHWRCSSHFAAGFSMTSTSTFNSCTTNLSDGALYISTPLLLCLGWSIFPCRRTAPRVGSFLVI